MICVLSTVLQNIWRCVCYCTLKSGTVKLKQAFVIVGVTKSLFLLVYMFWIIIKYELLNFLLSVKQHILEYFQTCNNLCLRLAYGLRCYACVTSDPKSCTDVMTCPAPLDRCSSFELQGRFPLWYSAFQNDLSLNLSLHCILNGFCLCWNWNHFVVVVGLVTKSCLLRGACISPIKCCDTDLCNSAKTTGSSVFLLLVSSVITAVFLWDSGEYFLFFIN